jgi:hypothetical protein
MVSTHWSWKYWSFFRREVENRNEFGQHSQDMTTSFFQPFPMPYDVLCGTPEISKRANLQRSSLPALSYGIVFRSSQPHRDHMSSQRSTEDNPTITLLFFSVFPFCI